jgi:hypothetical protein
VCFAIRYKARHYAAFGTTSTSIEGFMFRSLGRFRVLATVLVFSGTLVVSWRYETRNMAGDESQTIYVFADTEVP